MKMDVDKEIQEFSDFLAIEAKKKAECYPVDRYFLNQYISKILSMEKKEFLIYNFEMGNDLYSSQLMLCLPELWENLTVDDIVEVLKKLTNSFSFYAFLGFTYKYLEVSFLDLMFNMMEITTTVKSELKSYLQTQYPNLLKSEGEIFVLDEDLLGVSKESWKYIKQKYLLDSRVEPALTSLEDLKAYVSRIAP